MSTYVSKSYLGLPPLTTSQPASQTSSQTYTVVSNALNIRTGAGVNYSTNGQALSKNEQVTATGRTSGVWAEVKTKDGRIGWINTKYTK
jgi:uncharacterized protein YgiM (DUF1202 family)